MAAVVVVDVEGGRGVGVGAEGTGAGVGRGGEWGDGTMYGGWGISRRGVQCNPNV